MVLSELQHGNVLLGLYLGLQAFKNGALPAAGPPHEE